MADRTRPHRDSLDNKAIRDVRRSVDAIPAGIQGWGGTWGEITDEAVAGPGGPSKNWGAITDDSQIFSSMPVRLTLVDSLLLLRAAGWGHPLESAGPVVASSSSSWSPAPGVQGQPGPDQGVPAGAVAPPMGGAEVGQVVATTQGLGQQVVHAVGARLPAQPAVRSAGEDDEGEASDPSRVPGPAPEVGVVSAAAPPAGWLRDTQAHGPVSPLLDLADSPHRSLRGGGRAGGQVGAR